MVQVFQVISFHYIFFQFMLLFCFKILLQYFYLRMLRPSNYKTVDIFKSSNRGCSPYLSNRGCSPYLSNRIAEYILVALLRLIIIDVFIKSIGKLAPIYCKEVAKQIRFALGIK